MLFLALHAMIPMVIIHIQGDDGTVLIFALMFLVMTFAAGVQLRYFVIFGGLLVCAIPIIWNVFMNEEHRNRVLALFDLDGNALTNYGWQQYQGKVSIASGEASEADFLTDSVLNIQSSPNRKTILSLPLQERNSDLLDAWRFC